MKIFLIKYCLFTLSLFAVANISLANTKSSDISSNIIVELTEVDIYPNPAIEYIYLKFQEPIANDVTVEVRSFIGNAMETNPIVQQTNLVKISIDDLPAGHYYAIISYQGEKTLKKFIKRA